MNSQSSGRNQKPKGFKVKPAFQIALVLAVCFWLLYQVKYSHGKDYREAKGSDVLGRKGNAGWSEGGGLSGSEDEKHVGESIRKEDGGGGDDVLDGNAEDKNEEESFHNENDDAHGNLESHKGNEIEKEVEMQYKESNHTVYTDDRSDVEGRGNDDPVGLNENSLQAITSGQDGEKDVENISHNEVGEDKEQESHVKHDEQENEQEREQEPHKVEESSTNSEQRKSDFHEGPDSVVDGVVHGFDDENGVPVDGNDLIESVVTGSSGDHEMSSGSTNQSGTNGNIVNEEVTSKEGTNGTDLEPKSKIPVEDSKLDIKSKVETSSEIGVHADTTSIGSFLETTHGGSSVSDSLVKQKVINITSLSTS